jgi:hypothetical protein
MKAGFKISCWYASVQQYLTEVSCDLLGKSEGLWEVAAATDAGEGIFVLSVYCDLWGDGPWHH